MTEFNTALSFILVVGFLFLLVVYIVISVGAALYARRGYTLSQMISPKDYKEIELVAKGMQEDRLIRIQVLMSGQTSYRVLNRAGAVVASLLYDPDTSILSIDHLNSTVPTGWKCSIGRAVKTKEEFVNLVHTVEDYLG